MQKIRDFYIRLMQGRYGVDILNRDLSFLALGVMLAGLLLGNMIVSNIGLLIILYTYFRMFSKKISKRYNENVAYVRIKQKWTRKLKNTLKRIKDFPKYKYFRCPSCNKQLRVPRGKKEVTVRCPQCHHRFDART